VALATGSVLLVLWAVRTLGKPKWALAACLVEGHQLVTSGPYRRVRNPIYAAMLGMLVSTAVAVSRPIALPLRLTHAAINPEDCDSNDQTLRRGDGWWSSRGRDSRSSNTLHFQAQFPSTAEQPATFVTCEPIARLSHPSEGDAFGRARELRRRDRSLHRDLTFIQARVHTARL
jgi:hypothetical protein